TLRDALVHSLNVVTVEVAQEVKIGRVMSLATKAGLPKPKRPYLAMALGTNEATPLQVASAYTSFATLGTRISPIAIERVTTGAGVTVASPAGQKNEVLRPDVAYLMTSFMKDVVNRGTAAKLRGRGFKFNVAGKTGTSRDGWFAGYTPNLVCVVWVGFDDNADIRLTGADSALPIWSDFMSAALATHPEWNGDWQMPEGIQQIEIDTATGQLPTAASTNKRTELFINGTAPAVEDKTQQEEETTPPDEIQEDQNNQQYEYVPAPLPESTPIPTPRSTKPQKNDGRNPNDAADDADARLQGTITLDIDPTTGLIAVPSCPVIRTKTFVIGQEPRRYCGPEYHNGKTVAPSATRPRVVSP
ncbi:MAG: penicillin-binding transpeptidase domain-containing protein, partial [Pyrinomonadaceae bacterium]